MFRIRPNDACPLIYQVQAYDSNPSYSYGTNDGGLHASLALLTDSQINQEYPSRSPRGTYNV